jgi:hypothetical protein
MSAFIVGLVALFSASSYNATGIEAGYETLGCMVASMILGYALGFWVCGKYLTQLQNTMSTNLELYLPSILHRTALC